MNDDSQPPSLSWFERLGQIFHSAPKDRASILEVLKTAQENALINQEVLTMLEGVFQIADMQVRDIMIPRSQMVVVQEDMSAQDVLAIMIESAHSRFPVAGDNLDDIEGILLAKDLLPFLLEQMNTGKVLSRFDLKDILRPSVVVPESKRLDVLLKEFRDNRNHMAIVVDEYGSVAGLVTIEDVLEQIVGEIEDEHDIDEEDDYIKAHSDSQFVVKATTPIGEFNKYFECDLSDEEFDTLGGLILQAFGHMPIRGETTRIEQFQFKVISADTRRVKLLNMDILKENELLKEDCQQNNVS